MEPVRRLYRLIFAHKISRDLTWTFGSFAVLAISGVLINLVIAWTRDAAALGVFNIAYAVYLIGSQVASLGIHYSVLRFTAYHQEDDHERGRMLYTAIILSFGLGVVTSALLYSVAPFTAGLFGSADVAMAIHYAALGLSLFPLNKVLISYTNSLRHMKAFSVLQSLRYIAVFVVVSLVAVSDMNFTKASLSFFAAELITSCCCFAFLIRAGLLKHLHFSREWARKHFTFGTKGVMAGIFFDLNSRLDVLVLGTMLSEREVGIYSFAAMLIDGVQHILAILRVNFNPILVKSLRDKDHTMAIRLLTLSKRYVTAGTAALGACLLAGFMVAVHYIITDKGLDAGFPSLCILVGGFVLIAAFVPFDSILLVSGHPGYQTAQCAIVTFVNIGLCMVLVPLLGIEGAAIATVVGYIGGMLLLFYLSPHLIGWNLVTNHFRSA